MHLDVRLPIGLMFTIIGAILVVYGFIMDPAKIKALPLGVNVNLWSGFAMLAFGILMLLVSMGKKPAKKP